MSSVGYGGLLYRVSQKLKDLKDLSKINQIFFSCRNAGLIAEESESYNIQVNPGDNIAVIVMKLFSDLQEQDNLGIDNLENLRDLLIGVKEWSLIDEVDKFEKQRKEFNTLLETNILKLDELDNLEQLISLCADHISEEVKDDIKDVRSLFKELEKKNRLGFARLAILKSILNETGEQELLDALMKFEKKWKAEEVAERRRDRAADVVNTVIVAPAAALHSTVKHTSEQMIGAVKMLCKFSTVSGLSLVVGTGIILRKGARASLRDFVDAFKEAVLPAATELRTLSESSLCFTIQAENRDALRALWERYQDGTLQRSLQEFLVTDDIKQLADGEEVMVDVDIKEQEYKNACLSFVIAEEQALQQENQEMPSKRTRRNSDSILFARSKENEAMLVLLKLRQEEIKFHQEKIERLEKEIEKLTAQINEASGRVKESTLSQLITEEGKYFSWTQEQETQEGPAVKRFRPAATSDWQIGEFKARKIEDSERSRKRRRRNSDSDLYCKARDEDNTEGEKTQDTFLGEEKYAFVQRYLEEVHDRNSVTVRSDSGHVTHGAASELGMEDISDDTPKFCLKDLSKKVTNELERRLEVDNDATRQVYQSFGITDPFHFHFGSVFRLFPDTPVSVLKDVFEALQLYDLSELLDQSTKPPTAKSLRIALTLDEIKKLRNTADRPTTYHSCGAVLIFANDESDTDAIGIKTFFTDLDTKSDVTIIQHRDLLTRQNKRKELKFKMREEEFDIQSIRLRMAATDSADSGQQVESKMQQLSFTQLTSELQSRMQTVRQLKVKIEENETATLKEERNIKTAALTIIDRWFYHQDDFSFFALFDFSNPCSSFLVHNCLRTLVFRIRDKPKLGVFACDAVVSFPETLLVNAPQYYNLCLLLEILNKRWQTLDLVSMMAEFKRSVNVTGIRSTTILDSLSSLPKFKRKDDLSLSH